MEIEKYDFRDYLSLNFRRHEFACKCGCGFDAVDYDIVGILQVIRSHFNTVITITSGCRCEAHNAAVGGVKSSFHKKAQAVDFQVKGVDPEKVVEYIEHVWPHLFGVGTYETFVHLDIRATRARWEG